MATMNSCSTLLKPLLIGPRRPCGGLFQKNAVNAQLRRRNRAPHVELHPVAASEGEVYQGQFGEWKLEPEDKTEVLLYRAGISVAAVCLGLGVAGAFITNGTAVESEVYDVLSVLGAAGLGLSLTQIHIYVASLKRFIQILWAIGVAGGVGLMITQEGTLPDFVIDHPPAMWLVGPFFAAVTGVAFKEGVCYGKWEAALLFALVPILMLGHIAGLFPDEAQHSMMGAFAVLFAIFAARKYTQPIKDDIGDKTIFMFQNLSEEEQDEMLKELEPK